MEDSRGRFARVALQDAAEKPKKGEQAKEGLEKQFRERRAIPERYT